MLISSRERTPALIKERERQAPGEAPAPRGRVPGCGPGGGARYLVSGSPSDSAAVSSSSSSSSSVSSPRVAPSGSEPRALSAAWSLSLLAIAPAGPEPEPGRPSAPGVLPLTAPRPGPAGRLGFAAGGRASPVPLNRRRQEVAPEHLGPGLRFSSSRLVCQPPRPLPAPA